jgi:hypothetical protein
LGKGRKMMARRISLTWVLVFALSLVGAACGDDSSSGNGGDTSSNDTSGGDTSGGGGNEVTAVVKDFEISLDPTSSPAGQTKFKVTNEGPAVHEFVVFKSDLAADKLPVDDEGLVDEAGEGVELIGEVEDMEPNSTHDLSEDLDAGKYVIICNIPGHYKLGMATEFAAE